MQNEAIGDAANECYEWWRTGIIDNLLLKQKVKSKNLGDTDSGICASEYQAYDSTIAEDCIKGYSREKRPLIIINEDEIIDNIEMAPIESYYQRLLTPEGNVKYKNYKILAPAPATIRMYSPSGDIHTSPKKGKIVPKYELFHDSFIPRDKLLLLINYDHPGGKELAAIIRPTGISRKAMDILRTTNKSSMDDRIAFLNNTFLTPSPTYSIISEDSIFTEPFITPSPSPTPEPKVTFNQNKSYSIEAEDVPVQNRRLFTRQKSVPLSGDSPGQMNLSDELSQADYRGQRSHTPGRMTAFEYSFFHRPLSSMSGRSCFVSRPRETKKTILRNFIQRNMIDRSAHRNNLAKLALAIEEDTEDATDGGFRFVTSAQQMEDRLTNMLDETKKMKDELLEIEEDMQDDFEKVSYLLAEARCLVDEIRTVNYLDDVIALLSGNVHVVALRKVWPFAASMTGHDRDPEVNLIV